MKVIHAYNLFLRHGTAERRYAPETVKKQDDCFRSWLLPVFQDKLVTDLSRSDVLILREHMHSRGLSINRQYSILMTLKVWLRFCRTVLALKTLDPAEVFLPHRPAPHVQYLTNAEISAVRNAIAIHRYSGLRLRALFELLLGTGLRISEALALDRELIDSGQRELDIRGKGGRRRTVFFPDDAITWSKRFLTSRHDSFPALFVTTGDSPRRLQREDISRMFITLRESAGINKPLTPHLLRHTYCTNLLNNGADIMHIKELAGHSSIGTTARYYLGVDRDALRKVVQRLDYTVPPSA